MRDGQKAASLTSSLGTSACASRWFTDRNVSPCSLHTRFASSSPTFRQGARPGPVATATAVKSSQPPGRPLQLEQRQCGEEPVIGAKGGNEASTGEQCTHCSRSCRFITGDGTLDATSQLRSRDYCQRWLARVHDSMVASRRRWSGGGGAAAEPVAAGYGCGKVLQRPYLSVTARSRTAGRLTSCARAARFGTTPVQQHDAMRVTYESTLCGPALHFECRAA